MSVVIKEYSIEINKDHEKFINITVPTKSVDTETFKNFMKNTRSAVENSGMNAYIEAVESSGDQFRFSTSVNSGFENRAADYYLNVNDDVLMSTDSIKQCIKNLELFGNASLIGAVLYYPNRKIQHAGIAAMQSGSLSYYAYHIFRYKAPFDGFRKVKYFRSNGMRNFLYLYNLTKLKSYVQGVVTGAFHFMSSETLNVLKSYDESFRNGSEDVDFCLRAIQNKIKVWLDIKVTGIHYEGKSYNLSYNLARREGLLLLHRKWGEDRMIQLFKQNDNLYTPKNLEISKTKFPSQIQ